jgi:hypothetical protein
MFILPFIINERPAGMKVLILQDLQANRETKSAKLEPVKRNKSEVAVKIRRSRAARKAQIIIYEQ